jgi:hypothetical protein
MHVFQVPDLPPCNRHHAVSLLLANDRLLLDFVFLPDRRSLTFGSAAKTLRAARRCLDEQQRLLVHLALAMWLEKGRISFVDAYRGLSDTRFEAFLRALELLYSTSGCSCPSCIHRHLAWTNDNRLNIEYF